MRYIFKILILGNPDTIPIYLSHVFEEDGDNKNAYIEWYKEIHVLEDVCDLEIDTITNLIDANFDNLIPQVDGIIYFLNPLKSEEKEFLDMVLPIIDSVKRNVPMVLICNDATGILPVAVNEILEYFWVGFPQFEVFVNLNPHDFHQVLQCLCLAMISGDTPLDIENAWMRFPIFVQLANLYFNQKEYFYAAQYTRKAAMIAEILNREDFYIICEQAASLYSKINLYLEASKIMRDVDKKKMRNYKNLYAESMILEGNKLFNKRKFEDAARQYLAAAHWSANELNDPAIKDEAFRLAINSWISALRVGNAFKIINNLPHEQSNTILHEIADKVIAGAEFLIKEEKLSTAREELYESISQYQREGLFDILKTFTTKLEKVLIALLKMYVRQNAKVEAKRTYDEIINLWESYEVEKTNLDKQLRPLIEQFLDDLDFAVASLLINDLNSLSLKKELTEYSIKTEEKYKESKRKESEQILKEGIKIIEEFIGAEKQIIKGLNQEIINVANKLIQENEILSAADLVKKQADFYRKIGKIAEQNEILEKALDILLEGRQFDQFFKFFSELSKSNKHEYLDVKFPMYLKKFKEEGKEQDFISLDSIFETSGVILREQVLYEESKQISETFIALLKDKAIQLLRDHRDLKSVEKVKVMVKKAMDVSKAYLENKPVEFDVIYREITKIYLELDDLESEYYYNEKIFDKLLKAELHKKINKLESEKTAEERKKIDEVKEQQLLKERFSIITNGAREELNDRENNFKQRKGLRKAYYSKGLSLLSNFNLIEALEEYKINAQQLIKLRRFNLAGISFLVMALILYKQNKLGDLKEFLDDVKSQLSNMEVFTETFPITLVEYLLDLNRFKIEDKLLDVISLAENLSLFDEERKLLNIILGREILISEKRDESVKEKIAIERYLDDLNFEVDRIIIDKQEIAKRKLMKNEFYRFAIEDLSKKRFSNASIDYFDTTVKLTEKSFYYQAVISLMVGTLIFLRVKDNSLAKMNFKEKLENINLANKEIEKLPEIKIMNLYFTALEDDLVQVKNEVLRIFTEHPYYKTLLFPEESDFISTLIPPDMEKKVEQDDSLSRKELAEHSAMQIRRDQDFSTLKLKTGDLRSEKGDLLRKRAALRRLQYAKILSFLQQREFDKLGQEYYDLAQSLVKRKDFAISSLLILLYGLSMIKAGKPIEEIDDHINRFLNSLGMNKPLIEDTFYIRCVSFIITYIFQHSMDQYIPKLEEMMQFLPLFEEELILIQLQIGDIN
jgi:hypothetical protein